LIGVGVVVLTGLAARAVLPAAIGGPIGDALYATMAVLLFALIAPHAKPWVLGIIGWGFSAAVELLQLTTIPGSVIGQFPLARYLLGTTFVPTDLAWYALGAIVGAILLGPRCSRAMLSRSVRNRSAEGAQHAL
jgi:zinc D-Ala-D-Ala carboxypeptidase